MSSLNTLFEMAVSDTMVTDLGRAEAARRGLESKLPIGPIHEVPRVRLTVRRMMILVAAAGVLLATGVELRRRRARFRRLAVDYRLESRFHNMSELHLRLDRPSGLSPSEKRTVEAHFRLSHHFLCLGEKYWEAAQRPWLPVGLDPPAPAWPEGVPRAPVPRDWVLLLASQCRTDLGLIEMAYIPPAHLAYPVSVTGKITPTRSSGATRRDRRSEPR